VDGGRGGGRDRATLGRSLGDVNGERQFETARTPFPLAHHEVGEEGHGRGGTDREGPQPQNAPTMDGPLDDRGCRDPFSQGHEHQGSLGLTDFLPTL